MAKNDLNYAIMKLGGSMFYVKYKELTKQFNFSNALNREDLPGYIKHYILDDEQVLVVYKTERDHGVYTEKKIVLFDSFRKSGGQKQICTIPYNSIATITVTFSQDCADLNMVLQCGVPVHLHFNATEAEDKVRLRLLYTCINRIIDDQTPSKRDIKRLMKDDVSFER